MLNLKDIRKETALMKVLYVEDDKKSREQMTALLNKFFKKVEVAENGELGLSKFTREPSKFDIVFSDISMPVMDGLEMIKQIKEINRDIYSVIISAHNDTNTLINAIETGVKFFLIKPVNMKKFTQTVSRIIQSSIKDREINAIARLYNDPLTGLPSRTRLLLDLEQKELGFLIILDIDSFKEIVDFFGNTAADHILVAIANKLLIFFEDYTSTVYRLQADEFAIFLEIDTSNNTLEKILKELYMVLTKKLYDYDNVSIGINISIGAEVFTRSISGEKVISNAFMALGDAKEHREEYCVYNETIRKDKDFLANIQCTRNIKEAIEDDRVLVYYQPIISNLTGLVVKHECLLRIEEKNGKIIMPGEFLHFAKRAKVYPQLTRLVFDRAIEFCMEMKGDFSINISIEDMLSNNTKEYMFDILEKNISSAAKLTFEILEVENIKNYTQVNSFIQKVKKAGCKIAIDDFGTGYSNFSHLLNMGVDYLKIDGSIISSLANEGASMAIVESIVAFSKKMGIKTIAEFVSNKEIYEIQKKIGIDYAQGYYMGKPAAELIKGGEFNVLIQPRSSRNC
ncbi:EAL domain-containing response regulator [Candidatus Contubernalis alkaliaceticus]|uniref:EAL domain-containing response regulator n=1 Tax=Candidatus Contubernalis alkaliaceticus TaxID=338645 RepID=UPI001F4C1B96|nr:EAL domain-containing protein [Candidatus Contubernalis alkalaceticus]UNC92011.1 EAL domain-containing protein [Candidatus Contubernalis alkalaceticus]